LVWKVAYWRDYAALGVRPEIRKESESLFMNFCQFGLFHSYGAFLVLDEFNNLSSLFTQSELCPDAYAILIAIPIEE
jgi:hypothetical protein